MMFDGFDPDAIALLAELPDTVGSPEFADWCTDRLSALLPVHRWLVRHLT